VDPDDVDEEQDAPMARSRRSTTRVLDLRRSSTEHHQRRRRPPPAKATQFSRKFHSNRQASSIHLQQFSRKLQLADRQSKHDLNRPLSTHPTTRTRPENTNCMNQHLSLSLTTLDQTSHAPPLPFLPGPRRHPPVLQSTGEAPDPHPWLIPRGGPILAPPISDYSQP
jgi:hypothetical protein